MTGQDIFALFRSEYLEQTGPYRYAGHTLNHSHHDGSPSVSIVVELEIDGARETRHGNGDGPLEAFVNALGLPLSVLDYREHAIGHGADVQAACYIEMRIGEEASLYGVGVDRDIIAAAIQAVLGGVNRQVA